MSRIYVNYTLTGFTSDPDEVTNQSGVIPSKIWRVGDLVIDRGTRRYEKNGWKVQSHLDAEAEFDQHVNSILKQLTPGWHILSQLGRQFDAYLHVAVYLHDAQGPGVWFPADVLHRCTELNLNLDFDLYYLPVNPLSLSSTQ